MNLRHENIKTITTICRLSSEKIVTGHTDGSVCLWDFAKRKPLVSHGYASRLGHSGIDSLPKLAKINSQTFATSDYDTITIWNDKGVVIQQLVDTTISKQCEINNLMLDKKGNLIVSYKSISETNKNIINVWSLQDFTIKKTFHCDRKILDRGAGCKHRYPGSLTVLSDNRIVFSTYDENYVGCEVVIWNTETDKYEFFTRSRQSRVTGLTYDNDQELIVLDVEGTLEQWNIAEKKLISSVEHQFRQFGSYNWHDVKKIDSTHVAAISLHDISFLSLQNHTRSILYETSFAQFSDSIEHNEIWMKLADDFIVAVDPKRISHGNSLYHCFMGSTFRYPANYESLLALIHSHYKPEQMICLAEEYCRDFYGMTALHLAAIHDNVELAEKILSMKVDTLHIKNREQKTPYDLAVENKSFNMIQFLISKENPNMQRQLLEELLSPLQSQIGDLKSKVTNQEQQIEDLKSKVTSQEQQIEILEKQVKELQENPDTKLMLHKLFISAVKEKNLEGINAAMTFKVDMTRLTKKGKSALHICVENNDIETAIYLLDKCPALYNTVDVNNEIAIKDKLLETAYEIAKNTKNKNLIKIFADQMLLHAISQENINAVELALNDGADITSKHCQVLHEAVQQGNKNILSFLIEQGANVQAKNFNGETPLHIAAKCENRNLIKLLLRHHAQKNIEIDIRSKIIDEDVESFKTPIELLKDHNSELADEMLKKFGGYKKETKLLAKFSMLTQQVLENSKEENNQNNVRNDLPAIKRGC